MLESQAVEKQEPNQPVNKNVVKPFTKGWIPSQTWNGRRLADVVRGCIDHGIKQMKSGKKIGKVALSDKIRIALENDTVATLKALAPWIPRDINVEVNHTLGLARLDDNELARIVEGELEGELEDPPEDDPVALTQLPSAELSTDVQGTQPIIVQDVVNSVD